MTHIIQSSGRTHINLEQDGTLEAGWELVMSSSVYKG